MKGTVTREEEMRGSDECLACSKRLASVMHASDHGSILGVDRTPLWIRRALLLSESNLRFSVVWGPGAPHPFLCGTQCTVIFMATAAYSERIWSKSSKGRRKGVGCWAETL
jgi:hypothetical protein